MITAMILVFIIGYAAIALEHKIGINKSAVALLLGMTLWTMYIFSGADAIIGGSPDAFHEFIKNNPNLANLPLWEQTIKYVVNLQIIEHLGDTAEILFYLLGAMTIVELIDSHGGFAGITNRITTRDKKKLLWLIATITFFMSAVLDNLTTAIVMTMLLRKLISNTEERWIFGSMIIIAANAGGAWTPIGDVTTIMLWIGDNITTANIMQGLFLPSLTALLVPLLLVSRQLKGDVSPVSASATFESQSKVVPRKERIWILATGVTCLLAVPIFKSITHLPPFMGILLALSLMWFYTDIMYNRKKKLPQGQQHRIPQILSKIDIPTILFFLGILLSVAALQSIGVLNQLATFLDKEVHNVYLINVLIGFLSSVIDNVPLVAAAMGMYPILTAEAAQAMPDALYMANFVQDGTFWELLAYSAGVGGSILIIGSAAGVVVMGLEKINFIWYLKRISWVAALGFLGGVGVYILL